jgi:hypothetical protein
LAQRRRLSSFNPIELNRVFTPKQKRLSRHCSSGVRRLLRNLSVASIFALLSAAVAQDAGSNTGTNQAAPPPGSLAPTVAPSAADDEGVQNNLTNQFGIAPVQPSPVGPAVVGSPQPASPIMGTSALTGAPSPVAPGAPATTGTGFPLGGPFDIHPHLLYSFVEGTVYGPSSKTSINTVAPGFLLDFGTHWSIDYTPTLSFYSNPEFKDTTAESAVLNGNWGMDLWMFDFSQSYVSTTDPLVVTGTQTKQETYAKALNASYQMGSKMSLDLGVNQNFRDAVGLTSLKEWTTQDWLNYQAGDKFGMGIGLTLGYDDMNPGSSMPFEQVQGRLNYHPGPKLTLTLSGGVEDRQFLNPGAPPLIDPIFSAGIIYSNLATTISLSASRTVIPSLFAEQVEVITAYSATIRQKLTKKFSLEGDASYTSIPLTSIEPVALPAQYFPGEPPPTALLEVVRNDDIKSLKISLIYAVVDRITCSAFYTWRDNSSGEAAYAYTSRQYGFSLNYAY